MLYVKFHSRFSSHRIHDKCSVEVAIGARPRLQCRKVTFIVILYHLQFTPPGHSRLTWPGPASGCWCRPCPWPAIRPWTCSPACSVFLGGSGQGGSDERRQNIQMLLYPVLEKTPIRDEVNKAANNDDTSQHINDSFLYFWIDKRRFINICIHL